MGRRTLLLNRVSCSLERFLNCEEVRYKPAQLLMESLGSVGHFIIQIFFAVVISAIYIATNLYSCNLYGQFGTKLFLVVHNYGVKLQYKMAIKCNW